MNSGGLDAYLARIGYSGPRAAEAETLTSVHRAHAFAVPFENLDLQMGKPIPLDLPSLQEKIVENRRGGYCFEQNTLFLAVLRAFGFDVIACEARVLADAKPGSIRARTHMTLVVSLPGRAVLCDVGFGGDGPAEPVPLDGSEVSQAGDWFRVQERSGRHVLQVLREGAWRDQYVFVAEERYPVDFEVANWWTSTHPDSRFVKTLTVQRIRPNGRHVLRNATYTIRQGDAVTERELARTEILPLLREVMGIHLPDRTRFTALDG